MMLHPTPTKKCGQRGWGAELLTRSQGSKRREKESRGQGRPAGPIHWVCCSCPEAPGPSGGVLCLLVGARVGATMEELEDHVSVVTFRTKHFDFLSAKGEGQRVELGSEPMRGTA